MQSNGELQLQLQMSPRIIAVPLMHWSQLQVPSTMLSPNLHVLTCRLLQQELARGPAANENDYYMERYMLEPKRRNAHRTTANPEITHLRHTEMPRRALSRCAIQFGCKSLQQLAPVGRSAEGKFYDPSKEPPYFPNKGVEVDLTDGEAAIFLQFVDKYAGAGSFWVQYRQHQLDPTGHPSPLNEDMAVVFLKTKDAVLPGFKVASCEQLERSSHRRAASACIELELPQCESRQGQEVSVIKGMVAQILWCGMLAVWNPTGGVLSHVDRFACAYVPPTQSSVIMGGVNVYTAALSGPQNSVPVPLEFVQGPFIMLEPNPQNTQGHAETYRFFSTPRKHGLL
jgi:hypothetical protein